MTDEAVKAELGALRAIVGELAGEVQAQTKVLEAVAESLAMLATGVTFEGEELMAEPAPNLDEKLRASRARARAARSPLRAGDDLA